jgi:signal transduction histidine kinase
MDVYQLIAEDKRISIRMDLETDLTAFVDVVRIRQVFANLVDNALKYTADGGSITISGRMHAEQVIIEFMDNGMGISRDEQTRIWDRLYRGDKSRSQRGLGLGLSLVKAITQAHQGSVEVESDSSSGSTFIVTLPAAERGLSI